MCHFLQFFIIFFESVLSDRIKYIIILYIKKKSRLCTFIFSGTMSKPFLCFFVVACLLSVQAKAQPVDKLLRSFILPNAEVSTYSKLKLTAQKSFPAYAVKINGALFGSAIVRRRLADSLYILSFHSDAEKETIREKALLFLPVNDLWKLSPALNDHLPEEKTGFISLLITVSNISCFKKQYPSLKIMGQDPVSGSVLMNAPCSWITAALPDTNIHFISLARRPFTERELTGFDLSANRINKTHRDWPTVNGRSLTVSVKENKMDTADVDIKGRYVFSSSAASGIQTHATTMTTIIAGGGNTFYTGKGVAWGASVSSSDFANLLPDNIQNLQQLKVSVQNHSYGTGIENYYGADAAAYDAQLFQNPSLIHVFSAGNLGNQTSTSGNYTGIAAFANLSGSFKMAKNIITVGATDSFGTVTPLSSHGPSFDGRVKPELVALGEDGSSGAAAIVSGISLLVQDAWQKKKLALPTSSITKAILLNSADDVGSSGIDFISGYGSANAWRAIQTVYEDRVLQGSVINGQSVSHTITVPPNTKKLKLTICWTDPPAQTNSFKTLVNDLDLELYHTATAQRWLPWVLNSAPAKDSLQKLPVRKRDSLNNVEQITVDDPVAGNYEILVKGFSVTAAPQLYSVAWQYDTLEHFVFTYPVKGDNIVPAQNNTVRWETTLTGVAVLQYRINNGFWQKLAEGVDLSSKFHKWQAPDSIGALQLRLLTATKEKYTDTVSLSKLLLINTGFNCVDSFLIYWQTAAVDSYRMYRLGQQYLEPFLVLSDTALIQFKQNNPYTNFTIAPLLPFNTEGVRSYTFDYTQQQTGCYINGFIADPSGTNSARLSLQLGTTYRVAKIVFEKLVATGFVAIREISPVTVRQFVVNEVAGKGLNTYRAKIILQNGIAYYTQPENVLIFGQPYYIFPNPIRPGASLHVLTEDTDDTEFRLYDLLGRLVASYKINGFQNQVRLPLLQRGIYYYTISKGGVRQLSQGLIVQ